MSISKRFFFVSAALSLFVVVGAVSAPANAHDGYRRPWEARPYYAPRAYVYQPPVIYRPPPVYYRPWPAYDRDFHSRRHYQGPDRRYW